MKSPSPTAAVNEDVVEQFRPTTAQFSRACSRRPPPAADNLLAPEAARRGSITGLYAQWCGLCDYRVRVAHPSGLVPQSGCQSEVTIELHRRFQARASPKATSAIDCTTQAKIMPGFAEYQRKTSRQIPVVVRSASASIRRGGCRIGRAISVRNLARYPPTWPGGRSFNACWACSSACWATCGPAQPDRARRSAACAACAAADLGRGDRRRLGAFGLVGRSCCLCVPSRRASAPRTWSMRVRDRRERRRRVVRLPRGVGARARRLAAKSSSLSTAGSVLPRRSTGQATPGSVPNPGMTPLLSDDPSAPRRRSLAAPVQPERLLRFALGRR